MAEAFVRTIKRDYVRVSPRPDAPTVMRPLSPWFNHYNEVLTVDPAGWWGMRKGNSNLSFY